MHFWKEKGYLMKKLTVLLLVFLMAGTAMAGIKTTKPLGPLILNVLPDGTGEIINAGAAPLLFDGYTILSDAGLLGAVHLRRFDVGWQLGRRDHPRAGHNEPAGPRRLGVHSPPPLGLSLTATFET